MTSDNHTTQPDRTYGGPRLIINNTPTSAATNMENDAVALLIEQIELDKNTSIPDEEWLRRSMDLQMRQAAWAQQYQRKSREV